MRRVLTDFNYFVHDKQYGYSKALKAAIRKNNNFFEELLDNDTESSDNEEEECEVDSPTASYASEEECSNMDIDYW